MRPPVTYYGGKSAMAPQIAAMLPSHRVYVEPFFGSGAVFFAKAPATHEVLNDLDDAVVNFFRTLRNDGDTLTAACELTPYARTEHAAADIDEAGLPDVERARRWWVRVSQSFGHSMAGGFCLSAAQNTTRPASAQNGLLHWPTVRHRLLGAAIECGPAGEVMARFDGPETCHYVDPPYLADTRACVGDYRREMSEDDHADLLSTLRTLSGSVLVSGYASAMYDSALAGWDRVEVRARHVDRTEVLWANYAIDRDEQLSFAEATQ